MLMRKVCGRPFAPPAFIHPNTQLALTDVRLWHLASPVHCRFLQTYDKNSTILS